MDAENRIVLVTGATGFMGWHTAARLVACGHRVRALVRSLDKARAHLGRLGLGEADFVIGDMTDARAVERALDGCDAVVHAAAAVSVTKSGGESAFDDNVEGARRVLGGACERGLDPVVFVSSLTTILDPRDPGATTADSPLIESSTRYGRSKAASDAFARELQAGGAPVAIVYPGAIIGPDDPGRSESMNAFRGFSRFMIDSEGGTQFVDARDLAALLERIVATRYHGRIVAAGHYFDWRPLREAIAGVTGAQVGVLRAPGFVLRGAGRLADALAKASGRSFMIGREAMEVATRWRAVDDSPAVAQLGVAWRDPAATLADVYRFFLERGALRPEAVPRLAAESLPGRAAAGRRA